MRLCLSLSLLFLACLLLLPSCRGGSIGSSSDSTMISDSADINDMTAQAEAYADSLIDCLTLQQRVGQCFMPTVYSKADEASMVRLDDYINELYVGGLVLLKGDLRSVVRIADKSHEADVPLFIAIDAEWGLGMRLRDAPDFPKNGRLGSHADEDVLFDYGREVARECRRIGVNMVLGPVVDVVENPKGIIGSRSFGSDPVRVADLGVAYARGLESGGVASVAKHFPGHGSPAGDSHKSLPVINKSLHQLDSIDLYPFRQYVDGGLSGVMVGHLAVPAVDPDARPAAVSEPVIQDLLRGELGFSGLVLTDALNMEGADGYDAVDALLAGADIVVAPADTRKEIEKVLEGVRTGRLPESVVNDRCRRILFYKFLVGGEGKDINGEGLEEDIFRGTDSLRSRLTK